MDKGPVNVGFPTAVEDLEWCPGVSDCFSIITTICLLDRHDFPQWRVSPFSWGLWMPHMLKSSADLKGTSSSYNWTSVHICSTSAKRSEAGYHGQIFSLLGDVASSAAQVCRVADRMLSESTIVNLCSAHTLSWCHVKWPTSLIVGTSEGYLVDSIATPGVKLLQMIQP